MCLFQSAMKAVYFDAMSLSIKLLYKGVYARGLINLTSTVEVVNKRKGNCGNGYALDE